MFGLNKLFVIFLIISLVVGYYFNWTEGLSIIIIFIIVKFIWNILTQ
jgi:hypothetical protein